MWLGQFVEQWVRACLTAVTSHLLESQYWWDTLSRQATPRSKGR